MSTSKKATQHRPLVNSFTRHMMERYPSHWDGIRTKEASKKERDTAPPSDGKILPFVFTKKEDAQ